MERYTQTPLPSLELTELAASFSVPALVVHDPDDPMVPFADGQALATHWPGARLLPVSGQGHGRIIAAPEVVKAVMEFCRTSIELPRAA